MERLTNIQVQAFLKDFADNSEIEILEESKKKSELEQIAKARGIQLKGSKDLAGFKTIYTFANKANKNRARLPKKALLKALPSMIGKPVDIDHNRRYVIGHYIDYKYVQKDDMVVAYGVFYKSNFGEEWEEAKKLFKGKKLSTSYEIWCPKEKRRARKDGTYELLEQEIAGGALLYKEEPAFEDAKVLELAKKQMGDREEDLVYAKYNKDDLILCDSDKCEFAKKETATEVKQPEAKAIPKIKCSNCGEEFESGMDTNIKCPKCFAILNKSGQMIYPPQIKDFRLLCPSCKVRNWLILSKKEDKAKIRCMNCAKEYELTFATEKTKKVSEDFTFLYTGKVSCIQCGNPIYISGLSSIKERTVTCKKCGLSFSYNTADEKYKKISGITELSAKKIDKEPETSEKGGNTMADKKKVEKASEKKTKEHNFLEETEKDNKEEISKRLEKADVKKEDAKTEEKSEVKVEPKVESQETPKEEKQEEPKAEESKPEENKEETPKAEEKPEETAKEEKAEKEQPEVKAEEAPKAEEKVEEPKAEKEDAKKEKYPNTKILRKAVTQIKEALAKASKSEGTVKAKNDLIRKAVGRILDIKKQTRTDLEKASSDKDRLTKGINKLAKQVIDLRKQVELYESSAKEIVSRRNELDEFGKDLSDEDILNDDKFAKAKLEKENTLLKASKDSDENEIVGAKKHDDDYYAKKRAKINEKAFPKREE